MSVESAIETLSSEMLDVSDIGERSLVVVVNGNESEATEDVSLELK